MIRPSILAALALSVTLTAGCEKAADDQNKANAAQNKANAAIDSAGADATAKMKSAQADADRTIADAQASFMKLREDYRHTTTTNLADLDRSVTSLEAKEKTVIGKVKSDLDASLASIHAARAGFATDYASLENASALTWDGAKARLDKEWSDLKTLVDHG
jgi:hypothetical protein